MQDFKDNSLFDGMIARTALVRREDGSMVEVPLNEAQRRALAVQYTAQGDGPAKKIGRNSQCPCGSGKKHKKCCLPKQHEAEREAKEQAALKQATDDAMGRLEDLDKQLKEALGEQFEEHTAATAEA